MALMLRGARLVDPQLGIDELADILVRDGHIVEIGTKLKMPKGLERDLSGKVIVPGFIDMHVHTRDPGLEYKEDLISVSCAAARGGFVGICSMPNTKPATDNGAQVKYILEKMKLGCGTRVYPSGALTAGLAGETISEMGDMHEAGACAFTDDGKGLQDASMMRKCMEYALIFDTPILSHCEIETLSAKGTMNEGAKSSELGLAGYNAIAEELQIIRDIELARLTGAKLHIQHLTTARGLEFVRAAKREGIKVTCEVTPHHLFLSEDDISSHYDTNLKVNPPLRTKADNAALIEGVIDGSIDAIASDHAPHARHEKDVEFELAPFGMTGIETSLGLLLTELGDKLSIERLVELMAIAPRRILGLEQVSLEVGSIADLTVIDLKAKWEVKIKDFESKSKNSPFIGRKLKGKAVDVYVGGYATLENGSICHCNESAVPLEDGTMRRRQRNGATTDLESQKG